MVFRAAVTAEEFEALPEVDRTHYAAQGDGSLYVFQLQSVEVGGQNWGIADTAGLTTAVTRERTAARDAVKRLKALQAQVGDLNLDEARTAMTRLAELEALDPEGQTAKLREQLEGTLRAKFDGDRAKLESKFTAELAARDASITSLRQEMATTHRRAEISGLATKHKVRMPNAFRDAMQARTRVEFDDDGRPTTVVIGDDGEPRMSTVSGSTGPMTADELALELRASEEYGDLFEGDAQSGSGLRGRKSAAGPSAVKNPWLPATFNLTLQGQIVKENPGLAARFKQEAGIAS